MVKSPSSKGYQKVESVDLDDVEDEHPSIPFHNSHGWFSRVTFRWVTPIFRLGNKRQVNVEDLPDLQTGQMYWQQLHLAPLLERAEKRIAESKQPGKTKMQRSLLFVFLFFSSFRRCLHG